MKGIIKTIILTISLLSLFLTGMAQESKKNHTLGLRAGYVINHFDYEDESLNAGLENSFIVGLFGRISLNDRFYLQTGVNYTPISGEASIDTSVYLKDARSVLNDAIAHSMAEYQQFAGFAPYISNAMINYLGLGNLEAELRINSFNIPLLIGYRLTENKTDISLQGGIMADIFASQKTTLKGTLADILGNETVEFNLNRFNIGAQIGISVGIKHWFFDVNAYYGLSKIFKGNGLKIHQENMTKHFKPYLTNVIDGIITQYSNLIPELQDFTITDEELDMVTDEFYRSLSEMDTGDLTKAHRYCIMFTAGYKL